jgi:two-component system response regulator YesN
MFQVLLVEDDPIFRKILKHELAHWFPSIDIQEASDGKEALAKVGAFCPQIVFMDIRLPDESGLQLTKKIKAKCPLTSIAILTSHDSPEYRQAAEECGASHFFVKGASDGCEIQSFVQSLLEG